MRPLVSRIATLTIVAVGAGCGDGGPGQLDPTGVLTTVEVTPASTEPLFTVAPGNTVTLVVVGKDRDGRTVVGAGSPTFSSDNSGIASVANDGTITAVAAGSAQITASLSAGGTTKTGTATVTVQVAPATTSVVAAAEGFQPATVHVQAGGTVTWIFGSTVHNVTFVTAGSPPNIAVEEDGSVSRVFPTNGTFRYHCTMASMAGVIQVH